MAGNHCGYGPRNCARRTGLGMMECKRRSPRLTANMKKAVELLRIRKRRQGRATWQGASRPKARSAYSSTPMGNPVRWLEVNCETDFVAKDLNFAAFGENVARAAATSSAAAPTRCCRMVGPDDKRWKALRQGLVMKLGENFSVRRAVRVAAKGRLAAITCTATGSGVLVDYEAANEQLGRDLAMQHLRRANPMCVTGEQVPPDSIPESAQFTRRRRRKPASPPISSPDGRRPHRQISGGSGAARPAVRQNPDETVEKLLQVRQAKVHTFHLLRCGRGLEKKKKRAISSAEVMAQAGGA